MLDLRDHTTRVDLPSCSASIPYMLQTAYKCRESANFTVPITLARLDATPTASTPFCKYSFRSRMGSELWADSPTVGSRMLPISICSARPEQILDCQQRGLHFTGALLALLLPRLLAIVQSYECAAPVLNGGGQGGQRRGIFKAFQSVDVELVSELL